MKPLIIFLALTTASQAQPLDNLIDAMIQVESRNNPTAVNQSESAIGILQIRPIMISEINRICRPCRFEHKDAFSRRKSIRMFKIWYYMNGFETFEQAARNWNGGHNGHNKASTINYWKKVKSRLWHIKQEKLEKN